MKKYIAWIIIAAVVLIGILILLARYENTIEDDTNTINSTSSLNWVEKAVADIKSDSCSNNPINFSLEECDYGGETAYLMNYDETVNPRCADASSGPVYSINGTVLCAAYGGFTGGGSCTGLLGKAWNDRTCTIIWRETL